MIMKSSNCIMHTQIFNILQGFKVYMSCLMAKFDKAENLLNVLTKYVFLGFCRLDLIC
jgi:hypothetical protein